MDKTLEAVIKEVSHKPLRSSIITAAALIDSMLEKLILKYLIEDAEKLDIMRGQGCLSTFSSKIKISYALGLISKELYDDLNSFREIRNKCAHNLNIDSSVLDSIKARIKNFNLLYSIVKIGENEDLLVYTTLEFAFIFVCLIKRINNIEKITPYAFEAHDDYLGFDDNDYDFINNFSKHIK